MQAQAEQNGGRGAAFALAAALLLIIGTALLGPVRQSQFGGHDAPFALATLGALQQA